MNMRNTLSLITFMAAILQVQAQNDSYIYSDFEMKDGTIFTGYISRQSFVDKTTTIKAHAMVKSIDKDNVIITSKAKVPVGGLVRKTRDWLASHLYEIPVYGEVIQAEASSDGASVGTAAEKLDKNVQLKSGDVIETDTNSPMRYRHAILLSESGTVRFLSMRDTLVEVKSQDIVAITRSLRPRNVKSGISEQYATSTHSDILKGQVTRKEMSGEITLVSDSNMTYNLQDADVVSYSQVPIDNEQPYWEQMPFVETVISKSGSKYEGLIYQQKRGNKENPGYLIILTGKEGIEKVDYVDIQEIRRNPNEKFRPIKEEDTKVEKKALEGTAGRYILCDTIVAEALPSNVTCQNDTYYIEDELRPVKVVDIKQELTSQGLKVETKADSTNNAPILVMLVKEKKFPQKKSHFTLDNDKQIAAREESIQDGNGTFVYGTGLAPGYYVLYRKDTRKALVIKINE